MSSRKPLRTLLAAALALAAMPALAQDSPFSQTVFFGDSLTDSGHFRPALIQLIGPNGALIGRFTTNPGLVWSEYLADYYGTNAVSDNQGGDNYAVGGARTGVDTSGGLGPIPSLATQVNAYLAANNGKADPDALYSVWGGANDLFAVQANPAQAQQIISGAVAAEVGIIGALKGAGAQYVLVANLPDIGLTPASRAGGAAGMAQGTALADAYNQALFGALAAQGLSVIPVDTFHLLQEVVANPGLYGFSNVTTPACLTQPAPAGDSALFCNPASLRSPDAGNAWMFADGVHPTTATHALMAQLAVSMIEGPRQIAVLPHSEAVVGRARAGRVDARLAAPAEGNGMRWWADVRADSQRYGKGNLYDGMGPTLTFGLDWTSGNLVYGAFAGYGSQSMDWGLRRGSFDQTDASLGGYAGWRSGQLWANGQLSYSWLGFDTDREVQLGQATRVHTGSADGSNLSIGASAGFDFGDGAFVHGPVLSVLSQQIDIDGFAESDPALSSSLAYPDQSLDSLIGSFGWQFRYQPTDRIQPYARVTWDTEFEDEPAQAFASAQSIPGSLQYAVPGLEFDDQYGTLLIGARTELMGLQADVGATATFAQDSGNDATIFVTVGNRF
ncbi:MAG: autotransporter domain-containing protein [Lysobacteraceae bacterium]|nr:MAG: autotransporter domain-containing protein [Xanthomonadaceae bacterium]